MATTSAARKALAVETPVHRTRPASTEPASKVVSIEALLRESPVDLVDVVQDVVAQLLTEGRLEQVEVKYHLPEEPVRVDLPRTQLSQLLEQLVASACEAMKTVAPLHRVLRVIVEPTDAFGDYGPRVKVQDTGGSVQLEDGIRLAITRAEELGAALTVKPRPTGGNLFTLDVPVEKVVTTTSSW